MLGLKVVDLLKGGHKLFSSFSRIIVFCMNFRHHNLVRGHNNNLTVTPYGNRMAISFVLSNCLCHGYLKGFLG